MLGRKDWLGADTRESRPKLAAGLLVASSEAEGINPLEELADGLRRVSDHPASRINELLPAQWHPP